MTRRAVVGLLTLFVASGLHSRLAVAAYVQVTDSREQAKVLCEWIGRRKLPTGIHRPHVCSAPDQVSLQEIRGEIADFWKDWGVKDESGAKDAMDSFYEEWGKRWDPDYKCRAAIYVCRDGEHLCGAYRDELVQTGRTCPGVTDMPPPAIARAQMPSKPADRAPDCEQLADTKYPPIADNTQELLARAREQLAQNAAAQENLAAARAMSPSWTAGGSYVGAMGAAADQQRATQERLLQYDLEINRQQRIERQADHDSFVLRCRAGSEGR